MRMPLTFSTRLAVVAAFLLIACGVSPLHAQTPTRPNIVLIISDDHGYRDYGFMGHEIVRTPHLDRMAAASLLYTRGYTMPVCSPSLASLLTGKLPHQHGITGNDLAKSSAPPVGAKGARYPLAQRLLSNTLILPRALTDAGYLTFQSGKLWNTTYADVGFTHGMTDTAGRHGDAGLAIGRKGMQPMFEFIAEAQRQAKPFFVWYAPFLPHQPHNPPAALLEKYAGKGPTPAAERYFAMVEWLDQTCGELDQFLADRKLADNTVVIYLADNGWNGAAGLATQRAKLSPYELGIRTPMFVRWPGRVTPHRDEATLASIIDVAPTILNVAGAKRPADLPGLDLTDRAAMTARQSIFVEAYTHDIADLAAPAKSVLAQVVISGWSKLLIPGPAQPDMPHSSGPTSVELFDLKADPEETTNLAAQRSDEVRRLRALQDALWKLP
jgi:arylsulfatase A-like enzyme